jgi:4-hydroxyphenylpyruvate dioxygenase
MSAQPNRRHAAVTTFDNPMGIDGFEFVEFAAPAGQAQLAARLFARMGFTQVARHQDPRDQHLSARATAPS